MGCTEEVASVHVEGWNLSCRTWTQKGFNIRDVVTGMNSSSNMKLNYRDYKKRTRRLVFKFDTTSVA